MSSTPRVYTECPSCAKRFAVRPDAAGKRTTCTNCGESFKIEIEEELQLTAPPLSPAPFRSPPIVPSPPPTKRVSRAAFDERGHVASQGVMRAGGGMILMGLLSLILPQFGLQFRALQGQKEILPIALGLMATGVIFIVLGWMGWLGRLLLKIALAVFVLAIVAGLIIVYVSINRTNNRAPPGGWGTPTHRGP